MVGWGDSTENLVHARPLLSKHEKRVSIPRTCIIARQNLYNSQAGAGEMVPQVRAIASLQRMGVQFPVPT